MISFKLVLSKSQTISLHESSVRAEKKGRLFQSKATVFTIIKQGAYGE